MNTRSRTLARRKIGPLARLCLGGCAIVTGCGDAHRRPEADSHGVETATQAVTSGSTFGSPFRFEGERIGDRLGESIAGVGDVNGDGFDDVAVGAAYWEPAGTSGDSEYGRVYLFFGSSAGVSKSRYQTINGQKRAEYRADVKRAGDVNGDGYADVLIQGLLNYLDAGLYLYLGGPTGLNPTPVWHIPLEPLYPRALGSAGDLTGDRRAEVLVAVREYTTEWEYRLYVYEGTPSGLSASPIWIHAGSSVLPFVQSAAGVGDVTGDGFNDVIVGSSGCNTEAPQANLAGFWGTGSGLPSEPNWSLTDPGCSWIGNETENLGDVDGDGYADFVTSSLSYASFDFNNAAKAYRGGTNPSKTPIWSKQFPENNHGWIDAAGIGDAGGDGFNDLLLGLDYYFNPANGKEGHDGFPPIGRARMYPGSISGLGVTDSWWAYDEQLNHNSFAATASAAGDLNGDGFPDIALGDYFAEIDEGHTRQGFFYVFYGTGGPEPTGRVLWNLGAYEVGGSTRLADGTRLRSSTAFDIRGTGLGTQGRTRVKLEAEIKLASATFDGTGLRLSEDWVDTGTAGSPLVLHAEGLDGNTRYRFRARLVYRPDEPALTRHTRWFSGTTVITACDATDPDLDRDGICDDVDPDDDGDGHPDGADCAPRTAEIHPGAVDTPDDGIDQDCSGKDTVTCFVDDDRDGFGTTIKTPGEGNCSAAGMSSRSGDCDDTAAGVYPAAAEVPADGVDQDCDGVDSVVCRVDGDGDGFGGAERVTPQNKCPSAGLTPTAGDCDDTSASTHPGATDTPDDGIDQDCSGSDSATCYADSDGDGFGAGAALVQHGRCSDRGLVPGAGDCNDSAAAIHPGGVDLPGDGVDGDCDGRDAPSPDAGQPSDGAPPDADGSTPDAAGADAGGSSLDGKGPDGNAGSGGDSSSANDGAPLPDGAALPSADASRDATSRGPDPRAPTATEDGGCACRAALRAQTSSTGLLVLFALVTLRWRRRPRLPG